MVGVFCVDGVVGADGVDGVDGVDVLLCKRVSVLPCGYDVTAAKEQ